MAFRPREQRDEKPMKAIINGLRYDTDKAVCVGEADFGGSVTDFQYWEAGLYRTPRAGRFFLAGSGGPMTRWARRVDNSSYTGGSGIIPLTKDEALEWAKQYLTTAEIEAAWPALEEA
jgi:hypothetical protein